MREGTAERHNQAHLRGQTSCLKVSHFVVCFSICLAVHMYGAAKAAKAGLTKSMAFDLPFLLSVVFCVSVVTDQSDLTLPETARGIVLFAHGSGRGAVGLARAIAMWHGSTRGISRPCWSICSRRTKRQSIADGASALRHRTAGRAARRCHRMARQAAGNTRSPGFQLPTISAPTMAPSAMSVRRDSPRHMTVLPGGGSLARAR
jgi:hypothetical protein